MNRRLPPLNALRAFEASARHLSFARAADELGVTASAISHQVKQLEEILGTALFVRMTRKIALTEPARSCLPLLTEAFDQMAEAVARFGGENRSRVLTVSVGPSFAAKWLVPNIESFSKKHPDIDVRISANHDLVDFRSDDVDIAIRFGAGNYPGLKIETLFMEQYAPLCSPELLTGPHALRDPADLVHHVLLHDDSAHLDGPGPDWRMWLKLMDIDKIASDRGPRFSYGDHALQAAIEGQGVLLGRLCLAQADIEAGRLVSPFSKSLPANLGYFLVRPKGRRDRNIVAAFRDWILKETTHRISH
jgi:LysR family glycine cleavage system transcriptional activator